MKAAKTYWFLDKDEARPRRKHIIIETHNACASDEESEI